MRVRRSGSSKGVAGAHSLVGVRRGCSVPGHREGGVHTPVHLRTFQRNSVWVTPECFTRRNRGLGGAGRSWPSEELPCWPSCLPSSERWASSAPSTCTGTRSSSPPKTPDFARGASGSGRRGRTFAPILRTSRRSHAESSDSWARRRSLSHWTGKRMQLPLPHPAARRAARNGFLPVPPLLPLSSSSFLRYRFHA